MPDRRVWIWRSRLGWWVAVDPDETLATFDTNRHYRAWTRDRLIAKLRRKFSPKPDRHEEIPVWELLDEDDDA